MLWKYSISSLDEDQLAPVTLFFYKYFPAEFFEFSFNPQCKLDDHQAAWKECLLRFLLESFHFILYRDEDSMESYNGISLL